MRYSKDNIFSKILRCVVFILSLGSLFTTSVSAEEVYDTTAYYPFIQRTSYQYQGNGADFDTIDIILEYPNEGDESYQLVSYSANGNVTCYIFHTGVNGCQMTAAVPDYYEVEDLRPFYSDDLDNYVHWFLPRTMAVGDYFYADVGQSIKYTLKDVLGSFVHSGKNYDNVLVIEQTDINNPNRKLLLYYGKGDGLLLMESVDSEGFQEPVFSLVASQG